MTTTLTPYKLSERLTGLLIGTAVGDALGLPAENLRPETIRRRWNDDWRMRFIFGKGMISDDTEHTLMVAQTLLAHPNDASAFQRALAWKLRWWFAALPGGVGLATARACLKLWIGFPAGRSAVNSGGGGPAMRSAIIGAYFATDTERRRDFVLASSRLTHRSWQAETAALAVAESAAWVMNDPEGDPVRILDTLYSLSQEPEWQEMFLALRNSLAARNSVADFAGALGLHRGVTGYSLHVVPVAIYSWLRHRNDFRLTLISALDCGGDTDTVGAMAGALAGLSTGKSGIPVEWTNNICEWPRSISFMEKVAARLAAQNSGQPAIRPVTYFWPAIPFRNILFLAAVLVHGFRRLVPPY